MSIWPLFILKNNHIKKAGIQTPKISITPFILKNNQIKKYTYKF